MKGIWFDPGQFPLPFLLAAYGYGWIKRNYSRGFQRDGEELGDNNWKEQKEPGLGEN